MSPAAGKGRGSGKKPAASNNGKPPSDPASASAPASQAPGPTSASAPAASHVPAAPPTPPPQPAPQFAPTLGDIDLHLFAEGRHLRIYRFLGAHVRTLRDSSGAEVTGTSFAVWAPSARRVSVVGDFCDWDGRRLPLRPLGSSGVHERFVPGVGAGAQYKFEVEAADGRVQLKTDPYGRWMEQHPGFASRVEPEPTYAWGDAAWMSARRSADALAAPMAVYELHLGSWARVPEEGNRPLGYREIAPHLAKHVRELGFTHVEFMPLMEHPFGGSWGYQVTGYFAPTSRYGSPDDLRFLIDTLHQAGIGVLFDWVPAHFPADEHALARFDGTALYEHEDPRQGKHPDWDTLIFNYGRHEVANLLLSNAIYWLEEFHVDGLRVDAVASMLYLDYSRPAGTWLPNALGGRENLAAIDFLRQLTRTVREHAPGCLLIAEESTTWPGVTAPAEHGGLGFHLKWNLGWMHDTLRYFGKDPIFRQHHHNDMTFPMVYEHSERFLMPLSHDEVVHGKGSLLSKMHGDPWQQLANLRLLLAYQVLRPGKKLLFMGTELGSTREWNHDTSLDWHLRDDPAHKGLEVYLGSLLALYRGHDSLWRDEHEPWSFQWIECEDRAQSVFSFQRRSRDEHLLVVLNMTPLPRGGYRIGAPQGGQYRLLLSSDEQRFGGSGGGTRAGASVATENIARHSHQHSIVLDLPPLGALVLGPATGAGGAGAGSDAGGRRGES